MMSLLDNGHFNVRSPALVPVSGMSVQVKSDLFAGCQRSLRTQCAAASRFSGLCVRFFGIPTT